MKEKPPPSFVCSQRPSLFVSLPGVLKRGEQKSPLARTAGRGGFALRVLRIGS